MTDSLALYTTVYPEAMKYLGAWYESVCAQTDGNFDIWMGVDQVDTNEIAHRLGGNTRAQFLVAPQGSTHAEVRRMSIAKIVNSEKHYDAVLFVDSDDLLHPNRVETARGLLQDCDVLGCAMEIVQENGSPTGLLFEPSALAEIPSAMVRTNIFGLSNTVYRREVLRMLPPTPSRCRLVDWFMASAAWIQGARFCFDRKPRMQYRQYLQNTARVLPPFSTQDVRKSTLLVLEHYELVLAYIADIPKAVQCALEDAQFRAKEFFDCVVQDAEQLKQYVDSLNELPASHVWWDCVAHPSLEKQWKT